MNVPKEGQVERHQLFSDLDRLGRRQPDGPGRATLWREGDTAVMEVTLGKAFEGAPGRAHGGIVAALIDETMGLVPRDRTRPPGLHSQLDITYVAPTPIYEAITARARLVRHDGRKRHVDATVSAGSTVVARASALFIEVDLTALRNLAARPTRREVYDVAVVTRVFRTAKVPEIDGRLLGDQGPHHRDGRGDVGFLRPSFQPGTGRHRRRRRVPLRARLATSSGSLSHDPVWSAVVMVSVFAPCAPTSCTSGSACPTPSRSSDSRALVVVFVTWYRSERTLSIHSINTSKRELFYWTTVTVTFALGTAVGDFTATTAKLGYFGSGVLFCVLISIPAIITTPCWGVAPIATFWAAYILTRPLGASFADWMGVSHARGGLNLRFDPRWRMALRAHDDRGDPAS